jgi:hypothetical protein
MRAKYTPDEACFDAANAAARGRLNRDEINEAFQRIADQKAKLEAAGETTNLGDKLKSFAAREGERTRIAAAMQRRHAALNVLVRDRLDETIGRHLGAGLTPRQALLAVVEGTQRGVQGGRNSVAALNLAYEARYIGALMADIQANRPHLVDALRDPKLDADIMREMAELKEGGKPGITGNEDAAYAAKVFATYAELSRTDLNRLGASIGKLDGWAGAQTHDDIKMIAAGKDAWVASVFPKLDLARTFPDMADGAEVFDTLGEIFDTIITNLPNRPTPKEKGQRVNPANLAKSLGKSRVLHFSDADTALAYRDEFGYGNTVSGMIAHLRNSARAAANMQALGPNPELMFGSVAEGLKRRIKDASIDAADQAVKLAGIDRDIAKVAANKELKPKERDAWVKRLEARKDEITAAGILSSAEKAKQISQLNTDGGALRHAIDISTGLVSRPVNVTAAKIGSDIRAVQSMAKLGGAVLSSVTGDNVTAAAASMFRGSGFFNGLVTQIGGIMKGRPKGEQAEIAALINEGLDGLLGYIVAPAAASDGPVGKMSKIQEIFFRLNGLTWWTDASRSVAGRTIAAEMGMRAKSAFADLPANYRHVLGLHDITEAKWNAIRQAEFRESNGRSYVTPDRIRALSDDAIEPLVAKRIAAEKASLEDFRRRNRETDAQEAEWIANRKAKLDDWQAAADTRLESMLAGNEIRSEIEKQIAGRRIDLERAQIEEARTEIEILSAAREMKTGDSLRRLLVEARDGRNVEGLQEKGDAVVARLSHRDFQGGRELGVRYQRARATIRKLRGDIVKIEAKALKQDGAAIARVNDTFQRRNAELNQFVDRSYTREQARADALAHAEAAHPERLAAIREDGRRELELSVLSFIADEVNFGIIETDARSRRTTTLGLRPGTIAGETIRFISQFKSFPIAFTQRVGGRTLYGFSKDASYLERTAHIGTLIAGMTMAGYLTVVMKDLVRGYWPPRDPTDPKTIAAAFVQGGAAGLYGDFLFSQSNRFGGSVLESAAGPTIGAAADLIELGLKSRDAIGDKIIGEEAKAPYAEAVNLIAGNTPGASLFYIRPALDFLVLNSLRDAISPGYLRRQDTTRRKDYGQTRFRPATVSEALR